MLGRAISSTASAHLEGEGGPCFETRTRAFLSMRPEDR